jgi:hypothetical protein
MPAANVSLKASAATVPIRAGSGEPSARLSYLLSVLRDTRPAVLSLDVFDTLLYRSLALPSDIFMEMHRVLGAEVDSSLRMPPNKFAALRTAAEESARKRHPSREITLPEIAGELSRLLGGSPVSEKIMEAEIATEAKHIHLDHDIALLILHSEDLVIPYILVSDMYLGPQQIMMLCGHASGKVGVSLPEPLRVFTSGDHRTGKGNGLFKKVVAELGLSGGNILHIGDNPRSDVESAEREGITVAFYERESGFTAEVFVREERYLPDSLPDFVECSHNDQGLRTLRAKALASGCLDARLDHFGYGAFILGPILTFFADWVVNDCLIRNEKKAYCLMREGTFLASLINQVAECRDVNVQACPLWASRYALRLASIVDANESELRGYFTKRKIPALRTVARDLGLSITMLRDLAQVRHDEPLSLEESDGLVLALLSDTRARQQIKDAASERRARLLAYYGREGLLEHRGTTIVDLGWAGSLQNDLLGLLGANPAFRHLRGLYLATNERILKNRANQTSFDSFLFHLAAPKKPFGLLQRTPEIIEQSCMCAEGSFFGFGENGRVLNFPGTIPAKQVRETAEIQRGVRHFATLWLRGNHGTAATMSYSDRESALARLRSILARSLDHPLPEEVELFKDWVHDDNDGSTNTDPILGNEETRNRAQNMTEAAIRGLGWVECFWPAGLACLMESGYRQEPVSKTGATLKIVRFLRKILRLGREEVPSCLS